MKAADHGALRAAKLVAGDDAAYRFDDPRTTVVITNYNYRHFLNDCIESVLEQTRPPDQLIVVDDGSGDGSLALLETYSDRATILHAANRGQAAAFNLGFRHATGDVVLFLDADDLLRPDAIEVVLAHMTPDLALLFFGLEIIDASGRSTGVHGYSLDGEDGDNRPRLLRSGSLGAGFSFAPTSGNAFSRAFLERVLPMPEEPWRICADAYLVRAAALGGRVRAVRRVLGAYRVHGGNNYTRADTFDPWSIGRGLRDVTVSVNALSSLAACPGLHGDGADTEFLRLALRLRALEIHAALAETTGRSESMRAEVRRAIAATARGGLPLRYRIAALALLARFGLAAGGSDRFLQWAKNRRAAAALPRLLAAPLGLGRLEDRLAALERPRWLAPLPYGKTLRFDERGIQRNMLADGWSPGEKCWSCGDRAGLEFLLEPTAGLVSIELAVRVPVEWQERGLRFRVASPETRLWSGEIRETGTIQVSVDRDAYAPEQPLRLEIACEPLPPSRREARRRGRPRFELESLSARERGAVVAYPFLQPGVAAGPASLLIGDTPGSDWSAEPDGSATMQAPEAHLRLSLGPGPGLLDLVLGLAAPVPKGWLQIRCDGADIFAGETGAASTLQIALPLAGRRVATEVDLGLAFTPDDPGTEAGLTLTSVRLVERASSQDPHGSLALRAPARRTLNLGEVVQLGGGGGAARFLTAGWHDPAGGGVRNAAAEASLAFVAPAGARNLALRLMLRPVLPVVEGRRHILGVSTDGRMLQVAELLGEGEIEVALGDPPQDDGEVLVTVHSVYATSQEAGAAPPAGLGQATFELMSLCLRREGPPAAAVVRAPAPRYPKPAYLCLADEVAAVSEAVEPMDTLLERRAALAEAIWASDQRGIELLVARPDRLRGVERLGAATGGAPLGGSEAEIADGAVRLAASSPDPRDRVRVTVVAMLLLPAFKLPGSAELETLPAILVRNPDAVAAYLGRDPEFEDVAEVTDYVRHLERLLRGIETVLDRHPPGSALYTLAVRLLTGLKCAKAIFGRDNLHDQIRGRGRAIEKLLSLAGAQLARPRRSRVGATRLRVGVLVRHMAPSPEAWALLGMYRHFDRRRFDLTLITTDAPGGEMSTSDIFAARLPLAARAVDEAVAAVRELDLDVLVMGAYVTKWERVSAIAAHRLATIQVSACFNCPTTLGFRSFDHAVAWRGIEADDPQRQHTERLVTIDAPLQCCFDFGNLPTDAGAPVAEVRRAFGASEDAVLITCGAMAHKILPDLMAAWARILAKAEGAELVLYPFARCWSMPYSAELFRRRLDRCLQAAGVAPRRVLILDEQSPEQVRRILAASDVYLDSFPYTGATTVCEAFACGLPVVTLAGEMLREQTGAAWVRAYGLPELVAGSVDEYVEAAARLASNHEDRAAARAQVARVLATGRPPHADSEAFGAAFSDTLWKIAEDSGLFPGLKAAPPGRGRRRPRPASSAAAPDPAPAPPAAVVEAEPEVGAPPAGQVGAPAAAPVRVVVLTMPRSGSTVLCELLGSADGAEMHYELFHETEIQYRTGAVSDRAALKARDARPIAFAERIFDEAARNGARLVGFKLFAFHDRRVLRRVVEDAGTRIICLSRSNTLAMYSSRRIAEATELWQVAQGEQPEQVQIPFDPADFEAFEARLNQLVGEVAVLLAEAGREALFVEYKSMLQDAAIERMSRFIGVEIPKGRQLNTVRQNTPRTIDRFSNPDKVRRYLDLRNKASWAHGG